MLTDLEKQTLIAIATDDFNVNEIQDIDLDDYMVLTDDDANEMLVEYVEQSIWAFNANFLASVLGCPVEAVQSIQENDKCEGNNETFLAWFSESGVDLEEFVQEAASCDGRGHFLSSYDGNEYEVDHNGIDYYIYRTN